MRPFLPIYPINLDTRAKNRPFFAPFLMSLTHFNTKHAQTPQKRHGVWSNHKLIFYKLHDEAKKIVKKIHFPGFFLT